MREAPRRARPSLPRRLPWLAFVTHRSDSLSLDGVFLSQAICCRPPVTWEAPAPPLRSVTPPAVPLPAACSLRRCLLRHRPPLPLPLLSLRPLPAPLPSPTPTTPLCPSSFPPPVPSVLFVLSPSPLPLLPPAASPCSLPRYLLRHRPPLPSPTPAAATHSRLLPCPFRPASEPAFPSRLSSPLSLSLPSLNPLFFRTSASPLGPPGLPLLLPLPSIFAPRRVCLCLAAAAASSSGFCSGSDSGKAYLDYNC